MIEKGVLVHDLRDQDRDRHAIENGVHEAELEANQDHEADHVLVRVTLDRHRNHQADRSQNRRHQSHDRDHLLGNHVQEVVVVHQVIHNRFEWT